jgi:hypothetical protein
MDVVMDGSERNAYQIWRKPMSDIFRISNRAVNINNSDRVDPLAVNIDNSGREAELMRQGNPVAVNIDNSGRVTEGKIDPLAVNIDNSGRVVGGMKSPGGIADGAGDSIEPHRPDLMSQFQGEGGEGGSSSIPNRGSLVSSEGGGESDVFTPVGAPVDNSWMNNAPAPGGEYVELDPEPDPNVFTPVGTPPDNSWMNEAPLPPVNPQTGSERTAEPGGSRPPLNFNTPFTPGSEILPAAESMLPAGAEGLQHPVDGAGVDVRKPLPTSGLPDSFDRDIK